MQVYCMTYPFRSLIFDVKHDGALKKCFSHSDFELLRHLTVSWIIATDMTKVNSRFFFFYSLLLHRFLFEFAIRCIARMPSPTYMIDYPNLSSSPNI